MVSRNITPPFRFVCFTDDTDGIRPEVECQPLPIIDYTIRGYVRARGKSRLWSKQLGDLSGNVLFMDLDLVIVDNIDGFFDYLPEQQVVMTRNITNPLEKLGPNLTISLSGRVFISITTAVFNQPNGDH